MELAVANTITNFDPEKVVIGGGVINGGSIVLDTIRRVVGERALKTFADSCTVEKAVLGGKGRCFRSCSFSNNGIIINIL